MGEQLTALALTRDELENTLGVFFLGYVFSSVIYGFNFFQTWRYSSLYSSDPISLKAFVAIICLLDLGTVVLVSHALYIYLIEMFPRTIGLVSILTTLSAEILLAAISIFLVQSYYTYQMWLAHKRAPVFIVLGAITLGALALGAADVVQNRKFETFGDLPNRVQISLRQGLTLVAGLVLAVMHWQAPLQKSFIAEEKTINWFDRLLLYVIRRFSAANFVQLGYFITFSILPRTAYWLPFHLCAQKLYVNAFLNEINSRPVPRRRRYNDFGATLPRRSFMDPSARQDSNMPDSDNKTTIQLQDSTEKSTVQQSSHFESNEGDLPIGTEEKISCNARVS